MATVHPDSACIWRGYGGDRAWIKRGFDVHMVRMWPTPQACGSGLDEARTWPGFGVVWTVLAEKSLEKRRCHCT